MRYSSIQPTTATLRYSCKRKPFPILTPVSMIVSVILLCHSCVILDRSPRLKCIADTTPLQAQTSQKKYDDDDIYANVSQIADNIRMSHEVDQLKKRVTELENENSILKEENASSKNIIDDFHARRIELESELARLKNNRGFENNLEIPPKLPLSKPLISPRPDKPRI